MSNVLVEINGELVTVDTMAGETIVTHWAGMDIPVVVGGRDLRIWNESRGEMALAEARALARDSLHLWRQHFYLLGERSRAIVTCLNNMPSEMRGDNWHQILLMHEETARYAVKKLELAEEIGLRILSEAIGKGEVRLFILDHPGGGSASRLYVDDLPGGVAALITCNEQIAELYTDTEEFSGWFQGVRRKLQKAEETEGSEEGTAHAKAWLRGNFPPSGDPSPLKFPKVLAKYQINLRQSGGIIPSTKALDMRLRRALVELGVETKKNKPGAGRPRKEAQK